MSEKKNKITNITPGLGINTELVHAGRKLVSKNIQEPISDPTGAVTPAIYASSTFRYNNLGGYDYTRSGNPNFEMLSNTINAIENSSFTTVFASGVSAVTAIMQTLASGDLVLLEENVYGCTYRLLEQVYKKFGVRTKYVDFSNPANYALIEELKPKYIWIESPTNPLLKIVDIAAISEVAHKHNSLVIVDNTFCTGVVQKPLDFGADISLLSTTKYIMGHSVCLGGAVSTNNFEFNQQMIFQQKASGLQPSAFDAWLTQLGANTLNLRMAQHSANAFTIASWFEENCNLKLIRYPFLKSHPQHELAKKQMSLGSGILTIDFELSLEATKEFISKLKLFALAESLGGVESLVCHPASMTHASVPQAVREQVGITDSLVRFSIGIETAQDLIADLKKALPKQVLSKTSITSVSNI